MKGEQARGFRPAIILTVVLFFLWGMANNLNDILIAQFRRAFSLSDFETSFVQQAFYIGYFVFAIPAAIVARKRGYKTAIVIGLTLYGIGALLFYPAGHYGEYRYFLAALFVIASGLAFLETTANPLIAELGDPAGAARRLTLAQAANPVGTVAGVLIGKYFILSELGHDPAQIAVMAPAARTALLREEVAAVQLPYLAIGLVVLAVAVAALLVRFPRHRDEAEGAGLAGVASVLRQPVLRFAVIAQFFYVGAQVGLWSYTIRYAQANVAGMIERSAADYLFASLVLFGIGRFVGSALMARIASATLLAVFATVAALLTLVAAFVGGEPGLWALVAASFFMSVQFPTIFALGLRGLGPLAQSGASLIVMAIIGGAVLTGAMGRVSDLAGINMALLVPVLSFAVVLSFARMAARRA
nr:L-fucose:H+ symporter permease [Sphingomonas jinjuensis]